MEKMCQTVTQPDTQKRDRRDSHKHKSQNSVSEIPHKVYRSKPVGYTDSDTQSRSCDSNSDSSYEGTIMHLRACNDRSEPGDKNSRLLIAGSPISALVDSGCPKNIITEIGYKKLSKQPKLQQPSIKFMASELNEP